MVYQLNIQLPYDPAIALLGDYPREKKKDNHKGTYIEIFIVTLFVKAQSY